MSVLLAASVVAASSPAPAADDPEPSPLFNKSLTESVEKLADSPSPPQRQPPESMAAVANPVLARTATDTGLVCIYELVCATAVESALFNNFFLRFGDHRVLGACSTGVDCPERVSTTVYGVCLIWEFVQCDTSSLSDIWFTVDSCECDSLATMPGSPTCDNSPTCPGVWTCFGEATCQGQITCDHTCSMQGPTCGDWQTCSVTCTTPTCPSYETCLGHGPTCDAETCVGIPTCEGAATCVCETCPSNPTCAGVATCRGSDTCPPMLTCPGIHTCTAIATCPGGGTCEGADTCDGGATCGHSTCPGVTCSGPTCGGETCPGSITCEGRVTCQGATCDGTATCSGDATCMCSTCPPLATCPGVETCGGTTCAPNSTCPGVSTCESASCPPNITCTNTLTCEPYTATCGNYVTCWPATCGGSATCDETCAPLPTCPNTPTICFMGTCAEGATCFPNLTCQAITCGTTCTSSPTCPGGTTCEGSETCSGSECSNSCDSCVCIYELVCASVCSAELSRILDLQIGDLGSFGPCSTSAECPERLTTSAGSFCLEWEFVSCDTAGIPPLPSAPVSCSCDVLPTMSGSPTCEGMISCLDWCITCSGELSCPGTAPTMCEGNPSCSTYPTCGGGATCKETATCFPLVTCYLETCTPNSTCGIECDTTAACITIGVHQNPILPSHIQIYIALDEPVSFTPVLSIGNDTLVLAMTSDSASTEPVYRAEWELTGAGTVTLEAAVNDMAGNETDTSVSFVCTPTGPLGGLLKSLDGRLRLSILANAVSDGLYLLLFERADIEGRVYDLQPQATILAREARLQFTYHGLDDSQTPAENYAIYREDIEGLWTQLQTYVDHETEDLIAYTDRLGAFQIRAADHIVSAPLPRLITLEQNYPNPFNASTVIAFKLDEPRHVTLELFNILGEKIATLVEETRSIGTHQVTWDGRLGNGRKAPSGLYFYRLTTSSYTETRKMLLMK